MNGNIQVGCHTSLRLSILASGSSGNAAVLATDKTKILVDAGISKRETLRRMHAAGETPEGIRSILVSHEHTDHIAGLAQLAEEWKATVYVTETTYDGLQVSSARCPATGANHTYGSPASPVPDASGHKVSGHRLALSGAEGSLVAGRLPRVEFFRAGHRFSIGDIEIHPFSIPHDALDPVAFAFRAEGLKVGMVTDLGYLPGMVKQHVRECDCLVLESNHDLDMLKVGPYPWFLKQRLMSRLGHLSNHSVAEFLAEDFDGFSRYLVLAHLSENNNHPEIARLTALEALASAAADGRAFSGELAVAPRRTPLATIQL